MKKTITTFVLLIVSLVAFSQVAITIDVARKKGILPGVDSIYKSAIQVDSTKSVFTGKAKNNFTTAYIQMIKDFGHYLKTNGFHWGKTTQYFNRVYFNKSGGVDYYLYSFKHGAISQKQEAEFNKLADRFFKTYNIHISSGVKYAQCCPVSISD